MGVSKRLTEQQRKFAQLLVYNKSKKSNTQCAIEAGYAEGSSSVKACNLLNPNKYPVVVKYIGELQAEKDLILKDKALDVSLQIINYLDKEIRERKKIPLSKLPSPNSEKVASVSVKNPPTFQPFEKFLESVSVAPLSPARYLP